MFSEAQHRNCVSRIQISPLYSEETHARRTGSTAGNDVCHLSGGYDSIGSSHTSYQEAGRSRTPALVTSVRHDVFNGGPTFDSSRVLAQSSAAHGSVYGSQRTPGVRAVAIQFHVSLVSGYAGGRSSLQ